jgi:hypothetical protein
MALKHGSLRASMTASEAGAPEPAWVAWSNEQLLDLPMNQLGVTLGGPFLSAQIAQLYAELEARQLRFRPHVWVSTEWFTPDGVPGIAVPFYLAHPRLAKLELDQMLEVEGGTPEWCMRILRHEAGHAVENAYRLRRLRRRQQIFGRSSEPYPKYYRPRPYSRSFVRHLDVWYAQSHPDEDFAETFAVWLTPEATWAERYKGWPVLKKLQYVAGLMHELAGVPPPVVTQEEIEPLATLTKTLGEHYARTMGPPARPSTIRTCSGCSPPPRPIPGTCPPPPSCAASVRRCGAKWPPGPANINIRSIRCSKT